MLAATVTLWAVLNDDALNVKEAGAGEHSEEDEAMLTTTDSLLSVRTVSKLTLYVKDPLSTTLVYARVAPVSLLVSTI